MTAKETSLLKNVPEGAVATAISHLISTSVEWLGYALFFVILFLPTSYQVPKAILLALVVAILIFRMLLARNTFLSREVALLTLAYIVIGLIFVVLGLLLGRPGALRVSTVFVFWPLVYLILLSGVSTRRVLRNVLRIVVVATLAIGLYALSYVLFSTGNLPSYLYLPFEQGQTFVAYSGVVAIRLYSTTAVLFTFPFVLTALLALRHKRNVVIPQQILWLALLLATGVVILRGSNGMLLIASITPLVILLTWWAMIPSSRMRIPKRLVIVLCIALLLFTAVIWIYGIDLSKLLAHFVEGFSPGDGIDAAIRSDQFFALISEWMEHPIIGAGLGASAESYIRTPEMPWAYELTYVALLFQIGIVGIGVYSLGIVWIYWAGRQVIRAGSEWAGYMLPTLVGMTAFLIANATNPYLMKFDYLWVVFLPLAIINLWLRERRAYTSGAKHALLGTRQ